MSEKFDPALYNEKRDTKPDTPKLAGRGVRIPAVAEQAPGSADGAGAAEPANTGDQDRDTVKLAGRLEGI